MDGNILSSQGIHVAIARGPAIYDLKGTKLFHLKGANIYKLSGELVGHLNNVAGTEKRLDRSTDRLFARR